MTSKIIKKKKKKKKTPECLLSPLHLKLISLNMVALAYPPSFAISSFPFQVFTIYFFLPSSLIIENHTFREGSDNDRPRQHRDIIHPIHNAFLHNTLYQTADLIPKRSYMIEISFLELGFHNSCLKWASLWQFVQSR